MYSFGIIFHRFCYLFYNFGQTNKTVQLVVSNFPPCRVQIFRNQKGTKTCLSPLLTDEPRGPSTKILSEYDQKKTQSQTADKPMAPPGRATQQSRDTS